MSAAYEPLPGELPRPAGPEQGAVSDLVTAGRGNAALALAGLLTILVSAWGGIAPYVGPTFGYRATGHPAWSWTLAHAVLALVPGAVGVVAGLSMLSLAARPVRGLGAIALAGTGILTLLAGAWFVIGPVAWPLLVSGSGPYFAPASAFHELTNHLGASLGPGVLLCAFGGFTAGWSMRRRPRSRVRRRPTGPPALAA